MALENCVSGSVYSAKYKCAKTNKVIWSLQSLVLAFLVILALVSTASSKQIFEEESANKKNSVLATDNNEEIDNNLENNNYLDRIVNYFKTTSNYLLRSHRNKRETEDCGWLDLACQLRQATSTKSPKLDETTTAESIFKSTDIDIDNSIDDTEVTQPAKSTIRVSRSTQSRVGTSDDEDYDAQIDSSGFEGSGEVEVSTTVTPGSTVSSASGQRSVYRVTITVNEPYDVKYQDKQSDAYTMLYRNLTDAITGQLSDLPGSKFVTLTSVRHSEDLLFFKVIVDIGVVNSSNKDVIESRLKRMVSLDRRLGSFMVNDDNFTFQQFLVNQPDCRPGELPCRSGECLPPATRCNGVSDCKDGSDELGCSTNKAVYATGENVEFVTTVPGGVPVPIPDPIDRCRADDKVRCEDNSAFICTDQICDGIADCNDRSDEKNCTTECTEDEFMCDVTRCIPKAKRCDLIQDCSDNTDEQDCPGACKPDEMQCNSGKCIKHFERCNTIVDCPDQEDEKDCPCTDQEFSCDDKKCVDLRRRCDGYRDCIDGTDERDCPSVCSNAEFQCDDRSCIDQRRRCDGRSDCRDGSDERGCQAVLCGANEHLCTDGKTCIPLSAKCDRQYNCPDGSDELNCSCRGNQFRCENGQCLSVNQRCNGIVECTNGEDERGCGPRCNSNQFTCRNGQCIDLSRKCDGLPDCTDNTDEYDCGDTRCSVDQFQCTDGRCIPLNNMCNGRRDCSDGSDEASCPSRTCHSLEFTCGDGSCIDIRRKCDNRTDCIDGSDERQCGCRTGEFQCSSGSCIPDYLRCNSAEECPDGSDEYNCARPTAPPLPPRSCAFNQFSCHSGDECVPLSAKCDGRNNCRDYSDESNCAGPSGVLKLVTIPTEEKIIESREVVFQCRDESFLRARVRWVGPNGQLPPGSRDRDGRLEMPNIQLNHSGTYYCEAVNYPPSTPGQRVSVYLTVEPHVTPAPPPPPSGCSVYEAACQSGECIDKRKVCDGRRDCADGSDETSCGVGGSCEPNQFLCGNKKCIYKAWRCDYDDDCGDRSDEQGCEATQPGSPCRSNEYACRTQNQCIPRSLQCDNDNDCLDGSDERGCFAPIITQLPPPKVTLECFPRTTITIRRSILILNCTAIGEPTPIISWRRNWGVVANKCSQTSVDGVGTLICPDFDESDQGQYSCEALGKDDFILGAQDSKVECSYPSSQVCDRGTFNIEARSKDECINCFCFGKTTDCTSADLFVYQIPPPINIFRIIGVKITGGVPTEVKSDVSLRIGSSSLRAVPNGFQVYSRSQNERSGFRDDVIAYFPMPENFHRNQLKSYGGYLKFNLHYSGNGRPINAPDVIVIGNNIVLSYSIPQHTPDKDQEVSAQFWPGLWRKSSDRQPSRPAAREDIMLVLADVDNILIRAQYVDGDILDTTVSNIRMDSAGVVNTGQGKAAYIEHCNCPAGYTGLSCEECAPGYERQQGQNRWNGNCYPVDIRPCPPGMYGDPRRNIQCKVCPCPLTNPSNQFGSTCYLDTDGQPTCNCPPEYVGRNCERCARGYTGNPNTPGDSCKPNTCHPDGALTTVPDPSSGACRCKEYTTGVYCDQCQIHSFHLDTENPNGCLRCFCSGVTDECHSSDWYRNQVTASFTKSNLDFKLVEASQPDRTIDNGIHINVNSKEIVYQDFSRREPDIYYWLLPSRFVGDKVTSYGGYLNYTVRYVPTPGGQSSRNTAPDVQLISSNDIKLLFFNRDQVIEPNRAQTITVPLREQYWQRHDGQVANREHMIMALADLDHILIKATYTTNTREAALGQVSLDIAEERNTGQKRAFEVEQCRCPPGYRGLSCEDCDVGYVRSEEGLYLGLCRIRGPGDDDFEPCDCNGHSDTCDSTTGACLNCRDGTTGLTCSECRPGYYGDATSPEGCIIPGCDCDVKGRARSDCPGGQCVCKQNVEGTYCDRCRQGTFGLSEKNVEGCHECVCSGITKECASANLYREEIPMQILNIIKHGFTLTDSQRRNTIDSGFVLNEEENEIGYVLSRRDRNLYWSLPAAFTGNKVTSYGGSLSLTQRFTSSSDSAPVPNADVILTGNGITLYWINPEPLQPDQRNVYKVPLTESAWTRQDSPGLRPASRTDLLTVLSRLEAILIYATPISFTSSTYLSDVSMDTAVEHFTGNARAESVEFCRCPTGYRGTSCELCSNGYYRDIYDTSTPSTLGTCKRCPCNNNDESCTLGAEGRVICQCKPGYYGPTCDSTVQSELKFMIIPLTVENKTTGYIENFTCSYESSDEMSIKIFTISDVKPMSVMKIPTDKMTAAEPMEYKEELRKFMFGMTASKRIQITQELRMVVCTIINSDGIVVGQASAMIKNTQGPRPPVEDDNRPVGPPPPSISISISEPTIQIVQSGSTVRFKCVARSLLPGRNVSLEWSKDGGELPSGRAIDDRQGYLVITSVQVSDAGTYTCRASNGVAIVSEKAVLTVGGNEPTPPSVQIQPRFIEVREGDPVEFSCIADGIPSPSLRWTRADRNELNSDRSFIDGVFRINSVRKTDEGTYICTGRNPTGEDSASTQLIVRDRTTAPDSRIRPTVTPSEYNGPSGENVRFDCQAPSTFTLQWSKEGTDLPFNSRQADGVLTIYNVSPGDTGLYVCTATDQYSGNTEEVSARVNVISNRLPPTVRVEPERQTISQGTLAELRCIATGDPQPIIKWAKAGEELGSNIRLIGPVLRIQSALVRDRGIYICSAESPTGRAEAAAMIEVERREPPVIELYPQNKQTVNEGNSAILQCRVIGGTPSPKVRWARPNGQTLSSNIEQLNIGVLRFNQITLRESGQYICTAENEAGSVTAIADIDVNTRPVVSVTPSTVVTVTEGQRVVLTCTASGTPTPNVEWDQQKVHLPLAGSRDVRPSAVFEITSVSRDDAGSYTCIARNSAGTGQETVELIVEEDNNIGPTRGDITKPSPNESGRTPPTSPANVYTVIEGGRAELRCDVRSRDDVILDWTRTDNTELPQDRARVYGNTLYIDRVEPEDAGDYSCVGRSRTGSIQFVARATLEVSGIPRIKLKPIRQVVRPGDNVITLCEAVGDEPIDIQWAAVDRQLPESARINGGRLEFRRISVDDAGKYLCRAENRFGEAEAVAEVAVIESPPFSSTVSAVDRQQSTYLGASRNLRCIVSPDPSGRQPPITWYKDGRRIPPSDSIRGEVLILTNIQYNDQGTYTCEIQTPQGIAKDYIELRVDQHSGPCTRNEYHCRSSGECIPLAYFCDGYIHCADRSDEDNCRRSREIPLLTLRIEPNLQTVRTGDNLELTCFATGENAEAANVYWTKLKDSLADNIVANKNTLRIRNVQAKNGGVYRCFADTATQTYQEDYILTVLGDRLNEPPVVVTKTAPYGKKVELECETDLEPPLTYTWNKQRGSLPKDSYNRNGLLVIQDVKSQDAGTYICTAQNADARIDVPTILVVTGVVPHFAQAPSSYIGLPTLPDSSTSFDVEVSFKPESLDGLLLYNGQNRYDTGDFISLGLNRGLVEFKFDVGSGEAVIKSSRPLVPGQWHTVKISRNGKNGTLHVNGEGPHRGQSLGSYQALDLVEPLFIGGVPDFQAIHPRVGHSRGLVGCVSRLVIGGIEQNLVEDATVSRGITTCETCAGNPCQNKGVCQEAPTEFGYTCLCPPGFGGPTCEEIGEACYPGACGTGRCVNQQTGYLCLCHFGTTGKRCERSAKIITPSFAQDSFISYATPKSLKRLKITLKINPSVLKDGVVLYSAQSEDGFGDFIALIVKDRRLEFRFDSGDAPSVIRSNQDLRINNWVTVTLHRDSRGGRLVTDGDESSAPAYSNKNIVLRTPLYVGGYDIEKIKPSSLVGVDGGFHGCISSVEVAGQNIVLIGSMIDSANLEECSTSGYSEDTTSICNVQNPCYNGGTCYAQGVDGFNCSCPDGYRGRRCELETDMCILLPCRNDGKCVGTSSSYKCHCKFGYTGVHCDEEVDITSSVSFQGDGYIEINDSSSSQTTNQEIIKLELSTNSDGLILWRGGDNGKVFPGQDFMAVAIVDGHVEFSFELGSGPVTIRSSRRVTDGNKHRIEIRRMNKDGKLVVDDADQHFGQSEGNLSSLNTNSIFVGGVPNVRSTTSDKFSHNFNGCIHSLDIDERPINFKNTTKSAFNVLPCSSSPDDYEDYVN